MTIEEFVLHMSPLFFAFTIKIVVIVLLLFHCIFSIIVTRQTKLMLSVVEAKISPIIYAVSIIYFAFSFFVLILAIVFL